MASFRIGVTLLVTTLCTLINGGFGQSNLPRFVVSADATKEQKDHLLTGFYDAINLARIAAVLFDRCDPAFQRYFRPVDADFVQNVFRTIANIDLTAVIDPNNFNQVGTAWQPKFSRLSICLGTEFQGVPPGSTSCGQASSPMAIFRPSANDEGYIFVCEPAMRYPSRRQIENPPSSARDSHGNPFPGYTCDGLGDRDTSYMDTLGSTILHEMIHWKWLFDSVPDLSTKIKVSNGVHQINDFSSPGSTPVNGYGAFFSKMIKDLLEGNKPPYYHEFETLNNADNYVSFANSKFWSWRCNRGFGPATSVSDSYRRFPDIHRVRDQPAQDPTPTP